MPTAPEKVRRALMRVTGAAITEAHAVAAQAPREPQGWRAALFATAPLIVSEYASGAATLGADWFEEIRSEAAPPHLFTPTPLVNITDADVSAMVARTTASLHTLERDLQGEFERIAAESLASFEAEMQKQIASGFWDTVTTNADDDPDAVGWQRFARPGACKFCLALAARGAVYTKTSVRFAAHTTCHCVVGPSYDPNAPHASVMQYAASLSTRTPAQKAALRKYLNSNYPDAPG